MTTNTFLTANRIAARALPILQNQLVFPALSYNDYSTAYAKEGDTIQVKRPAVFVADEFDGSSINLQDVNPYPIFVKMDKIADVSVEVTAAELALELNDFAREILDPAVVAIAEKINADGLKLYKYVPNFVGTSGSTPDALADIAQARKALNKSKAPMGDRSGVFDPDADALLSIVDAIVNADKSGSTQALREGAIGRIQGIDTFMSQAVKTHTAGAYSALADVTAVADVSAVNAVDATTGLKYTAVVLESTAGASTAVLLKGDIINITDDDGTVNQVTVIEDTAAAIAGDVTAKVYPALAADCTGTAVTFPDVTAGAHVANLAFNKNAFGFVTRPMAALAGADSSSIAFGGLTMRVSIQGDISSKKTIMSIDVLYGYAALYPELATRILG